MASRKRGPPGRAPTSLEFGFICYISRVSLRRPVDTRADLDCRIDHRGEGMGHEVPPALRFAGRCSEPTLFHRRYCLYSPRPVGGAGAIVGPGIRRGCPIHAHGDRGSAAGRLPIRCRDRAGPARLLPAGATSDAPPAIRPRMARWSRSGGAWQSMAPPRCAAARSTRRANPARCAWARSSGVTWGGWSSVRRSRNSPHQIMLTDTEISAKATFAPIAITGGVLADEALALFTK